MGKSRIYDIKDENLKIVPGTTDSNVPHFTTETTNANSAINPTPAPVTAKILRDFCIV